MNKEFKVGDKVRVMPEQIYSTGGIDLYTRYEIEHIDQKNNFMYLKGMIGTWSINKFYLVEEANYKKITKVGFYKCSDGSKAEIVSIKDNQAIGWYQGRPFSWHITSGKGNSGISYADIVSEWTSPVEMSITLYIGRNTDCGEIYISSVQPKIVLEQKTITFKVEA